MLCEFPPIQKLARLLEMNHWCEPLMTNIAREIEATEKRDAPALTRLGHFIAGTSFPTDASTDRLIRDALIDVFGCILIGTCQDVAKDALSAVQNDAGPAPVLGTPHRLTPPAAAFANAVAGHALDFDDWEIPGNAHPTAVLVPAILAAGADRPLSGKALSTAYLAGFEVIARLGEGLNFEHYDTGWHSTGTLGAIGAAAAVARLTGLDAERTTNALSLAVSRASGLTCQFGADAKPIQAGFAAEAGVSAARLAAVGLTGQPHALDAPSGFAALTGGAPPDRLAAVLDGLEDRPALKEHGLVFKPYPSCGYTHRIIDAALALRERGGFSIAEIARLDIHLPDFHAEILPFDLPRDMREARFSLPFCAAAALINGRMTVADFEAAIWREPEFAELISKATVHPARPRNPLLNYDPDQPDRLEITLTDGRRFDETVAYPLGAPACPMTSDAIAAKFLDNTASYDTPPDAFDRLTAWREAPDIHEILSLWSMPE